MANKLIDIEGIGETYAKALASTGLKTTDDLLAFAGSASGRAKLAASTGLDEKLILEWVNRADLMRITGIGPEFSDLLEVAGVDTVKELARRVPANLLVRLAAVNAAKKLTRRTPNIAEVERWVAEAKALTLGSHVHEPDKGTLHPASAGSHEELFWASPSLQQLAEMQGVTPISDIGELSSPLLSEDEAEDLIADIQLNRR